MVFEPMDELQTGDSVRTPYGVGHVLEVRGTQCVVRFEGNYGVGYLDAAVVQRKKKLFEMDDSDKLQSAQHHREEGNLFFRMQDYAVAIQKYELARVYLRQLSGSLPSSESPLLSLLNNMAVANNKLGRFADSITVCDEGVACFSNADSNLNAAEVKCLYLRGLAKKHRGNLEQAATDLVRAIKADPTKKVMREEYEQIKEQIRKAKAKEAKMFKAAFSSPEQDTVTPAHQQEDNTPPEPSFLEEYGTTILASMACAVIGLYILNRSS